ncbi:ATP-dependent helicase rhp16 isoform X2 [Phalaenopsis equestris]|uniref:ATP-dependent helicase rhp16 isoform X2 n=1 Tax=Phalaenopsis equestris TaxID=78828 RepID=UPI0009E26CBE|nr:ATP-dependent helicase rhp16 isoform X2 [Phalaenopsis equestris]
MARRRGRNPKSGKGRKASDEKISNGFTDEDYVPSSDSEDVFLSNDEEEGPALLPVQPNVRLPVMPRRARRSRRKSHDGTKLEWEKWEDENEKWVTAVLAKDGGDDSDDPPLFAETMEPSEDVILPLLRFQREWLAWALKQEESDVRGGILADEMGMGKTIQAISLVLTARSRGTLPCNGLAEPQFRGYERGPMPRVKCTLVICPVVAVIQWVGEIDAHTAKGRVRVLVFHGPKRSAAAYNFNDYDFVITTYSTIENDYRKHMMPPKEICRYCGKKLYPNKMKIHLTYFCGPNAQQTAKQAKQVKKKKLKNFNWKKKNLPFEEDNEAIEERQKKKLRRNKKGEEPINNMEAKLSGASVLHSVEWERIILDEAHFIKDRSCNTARAVFALHSLYKWALSGTPLQNRVGELYSLVRFIQIDPYSFYRCRDCNCKILDYGSTKDCPNCPHSRVRHFCWWNRYISKPIKEFMYDRDKPQRAMILLKKKVLSSILLRRTKLGRASDLALPPRIVTLRRDSLDKKEEEFYEALYTQSRLQFGTYAEAGTLMNNYAHIFDLLTRLRQAVDHPYLVVYSSSVDASAVGTGDTNKAYCGICHDPAEGLVVTSCDHSFCKGCLIDYSAASGDVLCPTCAKPLTVDLTTNCNSGGNTSASSMRGFKRSRILQRIDKKDFKTSTKIDALKEEIRNMIEGDGSAKGIVFSQFTSFLDLINFSLQQSGITCVQLVGSMSLSEREKAIKTFTDDASCKIFLMSLKAGGVALNLTVASNVFLMDPWWNPAVERQAQDRIHRIGQFKPDCEIHHCKLHRGKNTEVASEEGTRV